MSIMSISFRINYEHYEYFFQIKIYEYYEYFFQIR